MILLLPYMAAAIWWDYSNQEFLNYEQQSRKTPIFAICTTPTCPNCRGLPALLRKFAREVEGTPIGNVIFTHIDCMKSDVCVRAGLRVVPTFLLIRGESKHWIKDFGRTPDAWRDFLKEHVDASVIDTTDDKSLLEESIENSKKGGTSFHLIVDAKNQPVIDEFAKLSSSYKQYGCSFSMEKRESRKTQIQAFFSPECSITREIDNFTDFIEEHKFSDFHQYDTDDMKLVSDNNTPIVLSFVREGIQNAQERALQEFSKQRCMTTRFGWVSLQSDRELLKLTNFSVEDAPFLYFSRSECSIASKWKTSDVKNAQILEKFMSGECSNNSVISETDTPAMCSYFMLYAVVCIIVAVGGVIVGISGRNDDSKYD